MNFNLTIFIDLSGEVQFILDKSERGARERDRF